jgi:hypothetical protein
MISRSLSRLSSKNGPSYRVPIGVSEIKAGDQQDAYGSDDGTPPKQDFATLIIVEFGFDLLPHRGSRHPLAGSKGIAEQIVDIFAIISVGHTISLLLNYA